MPIQQILSLTPQYLPGKENQVKLAMATFLARGHALIEDLPGMGKTTLVYFLAKVLGLQLNRIQFTSDLLPADILGSSIFKSQNEEFIFRPGPIFGEFILADELNRASPKTQSALLQAMEERSINIEGEQRPLSPFFTIMATQNPRGQIGTHPLPESQLDRFMVKFSMGYPSLEDEMALLRSSSRREAIDSLGPCGNLQTWKQWQEKVHQIESSEALISYVARILATSREESKSYGLGPRAGIDLLRLAKSWALIHDRHYVLPDDIKFLFPFVAGHRLGASESLGFAQGQELAQQLLDKVSVVV